MMVKRRLREQSEKGLCPTSRLHTFKGRKRNNNNNNNNNIAFCPKQVGVG
jgi:hypothetical protein